MGRVSPDRKFAKSIVIFACIPSLVLGVVDLHAVGVDSGHGVGDIQGKKLG